LSSGSHLRAKPVQGADHYFGIELLAVARHEHVAGLVNQPHGKELACVNCALGMLVDFAHLVHPVSKLAARSHAGKDDVSRVGKKRLGKPIPFTRLSRNVEFHHRNSNSLPLPPAKISQFSAQRSHTANAASS